MAAHQRAKIFVSIVAGLLCVSAFAAEQRHIVVVVWDGMRPDFVSEQNTPTLWKLAQSGVTFRNHHAVYPSATIVNGTAINTGVYPNRSGILVNHDYRPEIDARKSIDLDVRSIHDSFPFLCLCSDEGGEVIGRAHLGFSAELGEDRFHLLGSHNRVNLSVEPVDNRCRGSGGCEHG